MKSFAFLSFIFVLLKRKYFVALDLVNYLLPL